MPAKTESPKSTKNTKTEAPKYEIIRGRMPIPLVHFVRFNTEGMSVSAIAQALRTTPGKVYDIVKERGFKYITKDWKFSEEDINAAKEYLEQCPDSAIKAGFNYEPSDEPSQKPTRKRKTKSADTAEDAKPANAAGNAEDAEDAKPAKKKPVAKPKTSK